jgi:hypothetical protein
MRAVRALLCGLALLAAAGCATRGGVELEGRASQVSPPPSPPTLPSGTPGSADPVAVLRADPEVHPKIKSGLVPCEGGYYPVDDRYVDVTRDGRSELVMTLLSCPSDVARGAKDTYAYGPGYAAYVYDLTTDPPTRLLAVEDGAVDLVPFTGEGNDLALLQSKWAPRDDPCCPSDQSFVLFRWDGTQLAEVPK